MNHEAFYLVYFRSCNRIWCSRTGQLASDVVKTKTRNSKVMKHFDNSSAIDNDAVQPDDVSQLYVPSETNNKECFRYMRLFR